MSLLHDNNNGSEDYKWETTCSLYPIPDKEHPEISDDDEMSVDPLSSSSFGDGDETDSVEDLFSSSAIKKEDAFLFHEDVEHPHIHTSCVKTEADNSENVYIVDMGPLLNKIIKPEVKSTIGLITHALRGILSPEIDNTLSILTNNDPRGEIDLEHDRYIGLGFLMVELGLMKQAERRFRYMIDMNKYKFDDLPVVYLSMRELVKRTIHPKVQAYIDQMATRFYGECRDHGISKAINDYL